MKQILLMTLLLLCSVLLSATNVWYTVTITNYNHFPSGRMNAIDLAGHNKLGSDAMHPTGTPGVYQCWLPKPNPGQNIRIYAFVPDQVANGWWGNSTRDFNQNSTDFSLPPITLQDSSNPPNPK